MNKDIKQLLGRVRRLGWDVHLGGSGHWRCTNPATGEAVTVASSPRRPALERIRADLRRIGARI